MKYQLVTVDTNKIVTPHNVGLAPNGELFANGENVTSLYHISRFTGLKDENGVEIYEGDLINFYHSQGAERYVYNSEVKWIQAWCGFYFRDNLMLNSRMRVVVVGNKYQNPELIEYLGELT